MFLITEFQITKFQITKFSITKFLIDNIPKKKAPKAQSGQNTIGFLYRRPNWAPPPHPQASVPPPFGSGGRTTLTCERGVPIRTEGTDFVLCVLK
jgi:hypothetical protein